MIVSRAATPAKIIAHNDELLRSERLPDGWRLLRMCNEKTWNYLYIILHFIAIIQG